MKYDKNKTLTENLYEQGHGWLIMRDGSIEGIFVLYESKYAVDCILMGDVFFTKKEAEREVYRRKLEFEMKEWARKNNCLSGNDCLNPYELVFKGLNVYVNYNFVQNMRSEFGNEYDVWVNYLL